MKRLAAPFLPLVFLVLAFGCGRDAGPTAPGAGALVPDAASGAVELAAGSVDGLAAAVAAAGTNGTVLVKAGTHTESGTVLIEHPVTLLGEDGAVIRSGIAPFPIAASDEIHAALHIRGANSVTVQGIRFEPTGTDGNTAILIQDASHAQVQDNVFTGFEVSVMVQNGDWARIAGNDVTASDLGLNQGYDAFGVVVMNGSHNEVAGNKFRNGVFGLWACGTAGVARDNYFTANYVGLILCKVPEGVDIDGTIYGSLLSANRWQVEGNLSEGNFGEGYLAIDGANHNRLVNNAANSNGTYDIELTADSYRFGFFTPASHDNTVIVGSQKGLVVKDCGNDNRLIAVEGVDISQDPCY